MKSLYHIHIYIWTIIVAGMTGTNGLAGNTSFADNQSHPANLSLPDSLITDDCVYEYTFSDFDKAERIMQELRKRKSLPEYRLDITEGDLYYNRGYFHRALKFYKRAVDNDSVRLNNERFMEQLHRLISLNDYLHNDVAKAQYVDMLLKKAEQCGNAAMKSVALFNMGRMLYFQGNKEKGYELMKQAAAQMEQTDYRLKYDNLRYHYNTLFMFQLKDKRHEEALASLEALRKVVTSETGAEISMEGLADKEKKTMYAQYATVLLQLGRTGEADEYYRRFLALAEENGYDNYLIMTYLLARGMYDEVISLNTAREKQLAAQGDTVTYHMTTVKKFLGRAYEEKGNYPAATRYYRELAVLRDSIKNREQKSTALELAALYETHEKDLIIQQQHSDAEIRNFWLWLAASMTVLLGIILCLGIRYYRKIQFKNNALVKNINELLHYKEEIYLVKDTNRGLQQQVRQLNEALVTVPSKTEEPHFDDTEVKVGQSAAETPETSRKETDTPQTSVNAEAEENTEEECMDAEPGTEPGDERYGKELYERMEHLIVSRQLYLDPKFSGEKARKLVGIPRNRFPPFIKRYAGDRFPKYLTRFRLYYAARLLQDNTNYSIETVARESGIPALRSFHRLFLEEFGVTPTEYRKKSKHADN